MKELITIIVPIYKVEEYIDKCINSILNQTYKNLEIILVDDGSPDRCGSICDEYAKKDNRIVVIHKENGGLSDARNAGIEKAHGKYISFIDSDDFVTADYIEYMYRMLKKENVKLAVCGIQVVWKKTKMKQDNKLNCYKYTAEEAFNNLLWSKGIEISAYGKLYDRELWEKNKFPKGKVYEDTYVMYKIFEEAKNLVYGEKKSYFYIARKGSISKQKGFNKNEEDYILHTKIMLDYIEKKYPNLNIAVKRYGMYARFRILRMLVFTKPRNRKLEIKIKNWIERNYKEILNNSNTPLRDKIAIVSLRIGIPFFKLMWALYTKVTGRI